jgi:hypothetical protein
MELKNQKGGNLLIALGSPEFRAYFDKQIKPLANGLEIYRQHYTKMAKRMGFIALFCIAGIIVTMGFCSVAYPSGSTDNPVPFIMFFAFKFTIIGSAIASSYFMSKFKKKTKDRTLMSRLLGWFGDFQHQRNEREIDEGGQISAVLREIQILDYYNELNVDDCFYGTYNGLNVAIEEIHATCASSDRKGTTDIFRGLMVTTDLNKNFGCHAIIRENKPGANKKNFMGLERVHLEDPEFERKYTMYGSDQVKARYIATPSLMRRFTKLRDKGKRVFAAFKGQKIYLFMRYDKDLFELPINDSVTDIAYYQGLLAEMAEVFTLIDNLKLEQDIGL